MKTNKTLLCVFVIFTIANLCHARTKAFLKVESGGHTAAIKKILVTSDKKYLVSAADDKSVRVWNTKTKKEERKILGHIGPGSEGSIHTVALSSDDKYLAVSVHMGETYNKKTSDDGADIIRLYDFQSGRILKILNPKNTDDVMSLDFSDDGKYLASGAEDHSINVWNLADALSADSPSPFRVIRSGDGEKFQRVYAIKIFKYGDDYRIVFADYSEFIKTIFLYSLNEKKFLNRFKDGDRLDHIAVSDKYIAASGYSEHILIFDLGLKHLKTIPYPSQAKDLAFSDDGGLLLAGGIADMLKRALSCAVYDVNAGFKKIAAFTKHDGRVEAVAFLDNQTAVTAGGARKEIYFWEARTGKEKGLITGGGNTVFSVGVKGSYIGFGNTQSYKMDRNNHAALQRKFNLNNFTVSALSEPDASSYTRASAVRKGQKLFIDPDDQWDLFISKNNYHYRVWRKGGWYYHEAYGFADDGTVLSGGRGGEVRAYNNNGHMKADFVGHTNRVWDLAAGGNLLVTGGADQTIKLWNLSEMKSGKSVIYPMLNLFVSKDGEWIIWSKSGYYDASPRGDKYVGYHLNQGEDKEAVFLASDRFLKALYRPDIIRYILKTGDEKKALKLAALEGGHIDAILPPKINLISDARIATDKDSFTVNFEIIPRKDEVKRIWMLRNNSFIWSKSGKQAAAGGRFSETVALPPGENQIKIFAESKFSKSNPTLITVNVDDSGWLARGRSTKEDLSGETIKLKEEKPNLYLLAVGVSKYNNIGGNLKNLNFAHKDAEAVFNAFKQQKGKVYNDVISKLLIDDQALKVNIEKAFEWLKTTVRTREQYKKTNKIVSRDVTLIFLAGHGVKEGEHFYFLNHDADLKNLLKTGVRIMDQGSLLTSFPTEIVIMTDACHSGMMGGSVIRNIDVRELRKRLVSINERAIVIFNATTADKPSLENSRLRHGVFTKVMLDGLRDDDEVYLLQLISFVQRNVKKLTRDSPSGVQKPTYESFGQLDDYIVSKK